MFFEREAGDVFVFWFEGDTATDGQHLTEVQRQSVHEQICAWWLDCDPDY